MTQYRVAILGCGAIFNRHIAAIAANAEYFNLIGIYDPLSHLKAKYGTQLKTKQYSSEGDVYLDEEVNCIVILTPNHLHYAQAAKAIKNKKHVILEKPATFTSAELIELENLAKEYSVQIYAVLQVRLNPSVMIAHRALMSGLFGNVRSVSLVQRWQRPQNYFTGWRGLMKTGGGILREFGIHYLDVLQFLVGVPIVSCARFFRTKFTHTDISDTIYGLLDFSHFGGTFEVSIASEPKNLECTLSITTEYGFLKLGGKSLDEIITVDFLDNASYTKFKLIGEEINNSYNDMLVIDQGASPYHPELYRQIIKNPQRFQLGQMYNVIQLIEQTYKLESITTCTGV